MTLQTSVNTLQAFGLVGSFYDVSPRRVNTYQVIGNDSLGVQATGSIVISSTTPTANDTVTIGNQTYKFVESLTAETTANEVLIGANATASALNLTNAINKSTTGSGTTYGSSTTKNAWATAAVNTTTATTIDLTAILVGVIGDSILLSETFTASTASVVAFADGVDAGTPAKIGYACTINSSDPNKVENGGTGVFAGILVNPHTQVINGLEATLEVVSGAIGELCTFGHIIVVPSNASSIGNEACFNQTTGEILAITAGDSAPTGYTKIANASFILTNNTAGTPAVLELGN